MSRSLRSLVDDLELYHRAFAVYERVAKRDEVLGRWVDTELREAVGGWRTAPAGTTGRDDPLKVLSVGPGEGAIEMKILQVLHACGQAHRPLHTTVLEPVADKAERFKQRAAEQAARLPGLTFDWRLEKLEVFQQAAAATARFDFISCVHSIYYAPDLTAALEDLYGRLEPGGMMLIVIVAEDTGMGQVWRNFPGLQSTREPYPSSAEVESACARLALPQPRRLTIPVRADIGFCLGQPDELSEDGRLLLDFFAHVGHFVRDAPADLLREVQAFLASDRCSERGADGRVIFKGDWRALIIEKKP